jgi:hypothetical protein
VPTRIEQINGKYYARIKSRTNSIYLLIYNPCEFVDTKAHWGREAIDDMGSRLIAGGIGNHKYDPDRYITRAEFTAIIVKALGLKRSTEDNAFTDVKAKNWYADYIGTAWEYNLITGNDYSRFNPMKEITREEAMIIIERAMKLTGLMTELKSGEAEAELAGFADETQISEWARNSAVSCIRAGLVSGRNGVMLAPRDNITRAEAAVIIRRLLQKSGFIQ